MRLFKHHNGTFHLFSSPNEFGFSEKLDLGKLSEDNCNEIFNSHTFTKKQIEEVFEQFSNAAPISYVRTNFIERLEVSIHIEVEFVMFTMKTEWHESIISPDLDKDGCLILKKI